MEVDADLELLTSLLEENEAAESNSVESHEASSELDEYDELFDGDEDGSYHESDNGTEEQTVDGVEENFDTLFGDIDDINEEETVAPDTKKQSSVCQDKSKHELEDELRKMQEQMRKLQKQLQQTALAKTSSPGNPMKSPDNKLLLSGKTFQSGPLLERSLTVPKANLQDTPKRKQNLQDKSPLQKQMTSFLSPPDKSSTRPVSSTATQPVLNPVRSPVGQQYPVEKFSGLRLRKPRVSSSEMERKMNGRKLIRLAQLQNKIVTEKLEDEDWVTFGVIVKKITPQSSNNGKTFSIWRLNDLKNLDKYVSLFLFGDVHKEHWKTDQGTVIGLLNANPMKPKEGTDEVCLSVDNPQKVLLMGDAVDLGTCKARKKNGDPCTQMVNLNDCEYCQYHVQAQYKKVSSKRADLQSSYSGHVPKKMARGGNGLRERLCQDGFHYGGVSSMAYATTLASTTAPKKTVQSTLSNMVVRGAEAIALEARQQIAAARKNMVQSDEFKELMTLPTPGALNLKKHFSGVPTQANEKGGQPFQSISASALLKQQKQQMLGARKKRAEEIQKRFLESTEKSEKSSTLVSSERSVFQSPKQGAEFPNAQKMATPKLGRGFAEGEDVLFFDISPPAAKSNTSAQATKLAAIQKLQAKGQTLTKADPNSIKRKRSSSAEELVAQRVASHAPASTKSPDENEPAMKKHREQLAYLESKEFQKILNAKSKHTGILKEAEAEIQERYFDPLVKKEQLEEKMRSIREQECRVVTCKTCKYTHFKPKETCVSENHDFHWHNGVKRFFKCACGNRTISLDRLPKKHCSTCGLFKWERDGMLKEKTGPKIAGETLLPRGEEHGKFLNSH
ncbi:protein MCM10 homolog isoform X2 [Xenopus tropicalis]|uniref:Protein MCM10 homolog n=1 Tax=Xenopus tropicalis TaxID=8364 RepID=A0A8J0S9L0_XENTR|nr:protein MCM10 homolog isoform X2 [Xenopus tropicalis]XP_012814514.1 protein MCM10 homolog isoform X2 [Xenopus tropicalis]|eukprot:XP_012814513.1 PREDICTED: protein MCM10 homolog isoform X2 [Xenopus tropicalis]